MPEPEERQANPEYLKWFDQQTCNRCLYTPKDCMCPGACVDHKNAPPMYLDEIADASTVTKSS